MLHRDTRVTQNPKCESVIDRVCFYYTPFNQRSEECVIDRGLGPTPNDAGDELGSCDSLTAEHGNQGGEGD